MSINTTRGSDGPGWRKSSYSDTEGANCVEVAMSPGVVYVRDSKDREGPRFAFGSHAWADFIDFTVNDSEVDRGQSCR